MVHPRPHRLRSPRHLQRLSLPLAEIHILIAFAQKIAVFNILLTDKLSEVKFEPRVVSHPLPYECQVVLKSKKHSRSMEGSGERASRLSWSTRKGDVFQGAPHVCNLTVMVVMSQALN